MPCILTAHSWSAWAQSKGPRPGAHLAPGALKTLYLFYKKGGDPSDELYGGLGVSGGGGSGGGEEGGGGKRLKSEPESGDAVKSELPS